MHPSVLPINRLPGGPRPARLGSAARPARGFAACATGRVGGARATAWLAKLARFAACQS